MHRTVITLTAAAAAKASTPQSSAALKKTALGLSAARLLSTSANATGYSVIAASDETFEKKVLKEPGLTVVDFYADWCAPCRMLAPLMHQAGASTGTRVVKVNTDENEMIASKYDIRSLPTVAAFKDGEIVDKFVGFRNLNDVEAFMKQHK